jgi:hypothetical protein
MNPNSLISCNAENFKVCFFNKVQIKDDDSYANINFNIIFKGFI